jgi:hypothetical protein
MTATRSVSINICPYLGMKNDANSHMAFPSPVNYCYRCEPAARVKLNHQETFCLESDNYLHCEVYTDGADQPLPKLLQYTGSSVRSSRKTRSSYFLVLMIGFILFGAILWVINFSDGVRKPVLGTNTPTLQSVEQVVAMTVNAISAMQTSQSLLSQTPTLSFDELTPSLTSTVTLFPTLTLTSTVTNTATLTPSITSTSTITRTPSNTPTASLTPTITNTFTSTNTSTPTKTATIAPSSTPTQTFTASVTAIPPFSLDIPIGGQKKFVIHRVVLGENLNAIAERFGSAVEAIVAVNYSLPSPIMEGTLVIVPFQIKTPIGLPVLEPYQVLASKISIEEISSLVQADLAMLKLYNNCVAGQVFNKGNWLLIPRADKATPLP